MGICRYKTLLKNHPDMISVCDKQGIRIFVNHSYCTFTGMPEHEIVGTSILDQPITGLPHEVIMSVFELTPDNPEVSGVYPLKDTSGQKVWVYGRAKGVFATNGELEEFITIGRDVTPIKNAEEEKCTYVEGLERIAFMTSHKIRGPIATMMGLLELIRLRGVHPDQATALFELFRECIVNLDNCSREMSDFIASRQPS